MFSFAIFTCLSELLTLFEKIKKKENCFTFKVFSSFLLSYEFLASSFNSWIFADPGHGTIINP